MRAMQKRECLLDALARMSQCVCLSDMRTPENREKVLRALAQIPAREFPARDWRETALYLLTPPL